MEIYGVEGFVGGIVRFGKEFLVRVFLVESYVVRLGLEVGFVRSGIRGESKSYDVGS